MRFPLPPEMQLDPGEYIVRLGDRGQYPYRAVVDNGEVVLVGLTDRTHEVLGSPMPLDWRWRAKEAHSS